MTPSLQSATRGTVFYYAIATNSKGSTTSSNTVRVNFDDGATAAPTFVMAGPNQTLGYGTTTGTITTTTTIVDPGVNNASLKYQWYRAVSGSSTIGSTLLPSETSSALTPATNVEGTFYYYVVVSNSKAPTGVTSNIVTVTVGATSAPGVSVTPSTPQEVEPGHPTTMLSANVTNTGGAAPSSIAYQWYSRATDSNVISGATLISGANTAAFTPPSNTTGTLYYFCVATNAMGPAASNTVRVRVGFPPIVMGTNITLDGIEWMPIRQITEGGKTYTLIVSRQVLLQTVYRSTVNLFIEWETAAMLTPTTARTDTNNWYASLSPTGAIRSRAMVPTNVRSESDNNVSVAEGCSGPTTAKPTGTTDIAFALSASEVWYFMTAAAHRQTTIAPSGGAIINWVLRSRGATPTTVRYINGITGAFDPGYGVTEPYGVRPALWVE